MEIVIGLAIVIFSIILHEVAHGFVADYLGDPTARYSGRLTLNPVPHIDPVGSVLIPGILALSGSSFLIGWAKPVPYNPYNLKNQRWGEAMVAFAGPATNIILALGLAVLFRFVIQIDEPELARILAMAIFANLSLAILNLIPIPPLDGSKVLRSVLPYNMAAAYGRLEHITYALGPIGLIGVLILMVYVFSEPVSRLVFFLFSAITGFSL